MPHFTTPLRPQATPLPRERINYLAGQIHQLGARPLAELFRELDAGAELHERLERYAGLTRYADFILAFDGDRLPAPKIVAGRRR